MQKRKCRSVKGFLLKLGVSMCDLWSKVARMSWNILLSSFLGRYLVRSI